LKEVSLIRNFCCHQSTAAYALKGDRDACCFGNDKNINLVIGNLVPKTGIFLEKSNEAMYKVKDIVVIA
jgi:hypothetical protein